MNKELSIILPVRNEKESLDVMVRLLNSSLKFTFEVLIVFDDEKDNSVSVANLLIKEFSNIKLIHNQKGPGVKNAVDTGVRMAKYDIILINAVDEIFPIISIEKMVDLILNQDFDLVSGTRYSKGGLRLGGSFIGSILSKFANKLFKYMSKIPISDCTTGIKMMKKSIWQNIKLTSKPIGWVFAFELSIKSWVAGYKITEYPLKSVDRLFGGSSTFKPIPWIKEYFKCFMWGLKEAKKLKYK